MTTLTVVLISKNQAWNIVRLLDSVITQTVSVEKREFILVDSASTDKTVELAAHYPINILRLQPDQHLSPAAGRYVGYKHTKGDLVLFLDGDMELYPGWLEKALTVFKAQPEVAAITGKIIDVIPDAAPVEEGQAPALNADEALTDVRHMGGAAIYRRSVLEQVGTFNPYLYSDEEPELCLRIRDAGYRVVGLTYPIAYHYSPESEALSNLFARWQRKLYLGAGQNLRYHFGRKTFTRYLWERGFGIVPGFGMTAGLFCLSWSFLTHNWFWFTGWATIFVLFVTINVFRKRSLYLTVASLLKRFFILDGTIRGLFLRPLEPESYSAKFEVIQSASTLDIGNISSSPILR